MATSVSSVANRRRIFGFLGLLAGIALKAGSTVALADDLNLVNLRSGFNTAIESWQVAVERLSGFLFGWINLFWFEVSESESHVLVLALIFVSAFVRALFDDPEVSLWDWDSVSEALKEFALFVAIFGSFFVLPYIAVALLLPDPFGYLIMLVGVVGGTYLALSQDDEGAVLKQLAAVTIVAVGIVGIDAALVLGQ